MQRIQKKEEGTGGNQREDKVKMRGFILDRIEFVVSVNHQEKEIPIRDWKSGLGQEITS